MSVGDAVALLVVAGLPLALGFVIARWWFVAIVGAAWVVYAVAVMYGTEPHEQGEFWVLFLISAGVIAVLFAALGVGLRRAARLVNTHRRRAV